jgi:hypothetical protein
MAKIKNDNIGTPGATTNAAAANAKFTDIQTATTTSLSKLNVKAQGVDTPNIQTTGLIQDFRYFNNSYGTTLPWLIQNDGADADPIQAAVVTTAQDKAEISYGGSGITLEAGDLLRIQFSVALKDHSAGGVPVTFQVPDTEAGAVAIAFVMWDITSNALANYEPLPGRANLNAALAVGASTVIDNYNGAQTNYMTDGCAMFSYNCNPGTFGGGALPQRPANQVSHAMLVYQRPIPSPNQTVYGIKLFFRGGMSYETLLGPERRVLTNKAPPPGGGGVVLRHSIDYVNMVSMHMRHGTVT